MGADFEPQSEDQTGKYHKLDSSIRKTDLPCDLKVCGCQKTSFIWVSPKRKAIYFETPKTACSSIKSCLGIAPGASWIGHARSWRYGFRMERGLSPEEVLEKYPDFFSFGFVRDPVRRTVSNYSMFCRSGIAFRELQIAELFNKPADRISFREFVYGMSEIANHHWAPYANYLPFEHGRPALDFVGRVESIGADWPQLATKLGFPGRLPRMNRSVRLSIEPDSDCLEKIATQFARDYLYFYRADKA